VNTVYVIAVVTSLNCGVDVLCLRAIEPDPTGEHAQTYSTMHDCIAALHILWAKAQHEARHQLDLRCVLEGSARAQLSPTSNDETQAYLMMALDPTQTIRDRVLAHTLPDSRHCCEQPCPPRST
jgi:hypothetical protein